MYILLSVNKYKRIIRLIIKIRKQVIIIREIEGVVPLKIGFIGYNSRLTQDGLMQFAENNKEDVEICNYRQSYWNLRNKKL